jgi:uncharacterized protein (TIGR03083 family)
VNGPELTSADLATELRFALAEGEALDVPAALRERVLARAADQRTPGGVVAPPARITGAEAFARIVDRLGVLLRSLDPADWERSPLGYRDVQGLVGHLIGVEEGFVAVLHGEADRAVGSDHRAMARPGVDRQAGQAPTTTVDAWTSVTSAALTAIAGRDLGAVVGFYGTSFTLDDLLVLRAFEMWIHDEDIRRVTGRELLDPDPEVLARMVEVAVSILPGGVALAGRARQGQAVRLVLTGASGGTWDVALDGTEVSGPTDARVVVDAAAFCRVIGNREDAASVGAVITGSAAAAEDLLVGASALALD